MRKIFVTAFAAAAFLSMPLISVANAQSAPKSVIRSVKNSDPFLTGSPFTFDQVLKLMKQSAIPVRRRKEAIQKRGVDFEFSGEMAAKLKGAGATEELVEAVKSKAKVNVAHLPPAAEPAPVPAPPPPPPMGALTVSCAPAECEVSLNGTPRGSTSNGSLEVGGLAPGSWAVDLSKNGFISSQTTVAVEADKTAALHVALNPNRATQEAFGAELFAKVLQAMGGIDGLKELASVQASGNATVWDCDTRSIRWNVLMRNRTDKALFQATFGPGNLYEVSFAGDQVKTSKNKVPNTTDLAMHFGLVRNHQLAALIAKLQDPAVKMVSNHPVPVAGEEFNLVAENGEEKISLALDSELRPHRVRIVNATGSSTIEYSNYERNFAKSLMIKPDGWQHGVEVHFEKVQTSPKLTDNDYKVRGKRLNP